jgi:hypothetical protein
MSEVHDLIEWLRGLAKKVDSGPADMNVDHRQGRRLHDPILP